MISSIFAQNPARSSSHAEGKRLFESRCATCHGLDGRGGEHAPNVVDEPRVRELTDQALFEVIHHGVPQRGMPGFSDLDKEDTDELVSYLRSLQGKSASASVAGDPIRGRDLFFGKAECSSCHVSRGRGQFLAADLTDFARDHEPSEIRDMILRPSGEARDVATAVAQDGRKFSGIIRNEDNTSLQLQDRDGRFYLLMKSSLVSVQRQPASPMPVDYGQRLSPAELDDLASYLAAESQASDSSEKEVDPHAQN